MPLASHLLDLVVVPADPSAAVDEAAVLALLLGWQARGYLVPGRAPLRFGSGPRAGDLVEGGFASLWLDRPEGLALYANQQGGFQVPCPTCGGPLARPYGQAVQALRAGREQPVACPACGDAFPPQALALRPPGYLARGALIFADAGSDRLVDPARRELAGVLGGVRLVARRRS